MFKHANMYVPGSKVRVLNNPDSDKTASEEKLGSIEDVDADHNTATIKYADGELVTVSLERIEPLGES